MQNQSNNPLYVPIESLSEYNVAEILFDGQEILEKPLNPSENFQRIVNKINFDEVFSASDINNKDDSLKEPNTSDSSKSSQWPFEKAKCSLRNALNQICALTDVLSVVRDKRYMVLEPFCADPTEQKNAYILAGKKSALNNASEILLKGSEDLNKRHSEATDNRSRRAGGSGGGKGSSYHSDLIELRRRFRLKMFAHSIMGDLSRRSVGSLHPESGSFEVRERSDGTGSETGHSTAGTPGDLQSTSLTLSGDEEGQTYIRVTLSSFSSPSSSSTTLWERVLMGRRPSILPPSTSAEGHISRIQRGQNAIVCREIHTRLCQEAAYYSGDSDCCVYVANDNIVATIFPGVQVTLRLERHLDSSSLPNTSSEQLLYLPSADCPNDSSTAVGLELQLRILLGNTHARLRRARTLAVPVTSSVLLSEERRVAGPLETSADQLKSGAKDTDILLKIFLDNCRHYWLRERVQETLSSLVREISDPMLVVHWNVINSCRQSTAKLDLVTQGYEIHKNRLALVINTQTVEANFNNGCVVRLGYDMKELTAFLRHQIVHHDISIVQSVVNKVLVWHLLATSVHSAYGQEGTEGASPVLLLSSPDYTKLVCIRGEHKGGAHFYLQSIDGPSALLTDHSQVTEPSWNAQQQGFREVDLRRVVGGSVVAKIETLLAALTKI